MMNGISAVLIVKNEEKLLSRCLESLSLVDEIVVVDTGSTDRTIEIAKKFTSQVYSCYPAHKKCALVKPNQPTPAADPFHFAQARNLALEHVKQHWALTIDADEICHPGCIEEIRRAIRKDMFASGFTVKFIVSNEGGKDRASLPKMKVFRKRDWNWQNRIHEVLVPTKKPDKIRVVDLPEAVMEHLPAEDKTIRREQNLELLKLSVQESPEYIRNARQLGMELFSREQYRDALQWLELYLASGTGGILDRSETMVHVARCHGGIGVLEDAIPWFDKAAAEAPMRREPHYYKALALIKEAYLDQAVEALEACLSIPAAVKPDFYLNVENIWDGTYPREALQFCQEQISIAKARLAQKKGPA